MNDHEALVLKITQNSPLSKVWRFSPTSYAEREITCPPLNATICPYCTYSTSHSHSCDPSDVVHARGPRQPMLDPTCSSIVPHLTASIPGGHPCRVSPASLSARLAGAGTGLAQRCALPSLTHVTTHYTQYGHGLCHMGAAQGRIRHKKTHTQSYYNPQILTNDQPIRDMWFI